MMSAAAAPAAAVADAAAAVAVAVAVGAAGPESSGSVWVCWVVEPADTRAG